MPDWTKPMTQTFEFYTVDPNTWSDVKRVTTVKSCTINRDTDSESLGSATIDINDSLGECYIRAYLITLQNGVREKHPLGTYLIQTPSSTFDGKTRSVSMDAYTPLLELKEKLPPIGYYVSKGSNIMERVYMATRENVRAPVIAPSCDKSLRSEFVADPKNTWMSFLIDLAAQADYTFSLDEYSRILFAPKQDITAMVPVWTYTDDNSSILYSDLTMDHDLYGIPNVVEVIYSNGLDYYQKPVVVENNDPNSPTSIVNRGRRIVHRVLDPDLNVISGLKDGVDAEPVTKPMIEEYANRLLKEMSTIEYTISYSHGYCPVRVGDCVRLNYSRAGLTGIKARVVSQSINCTPGCQVSEKAVFTAKLWG